MKKTYQPYFTFLLTACLMFGSWIARAQNVSDISSFLKLEQQNASKLIGAYSEPAIRAISFGMTNGWYHTGKTHAKLGVDVSFTMSAVMAPTSDNYFSPGDLKLTNTSFTNNTNPGLGSPSVFGPKDLTTYTSTYTPSGTASALGPQSVSFNGPEGLDFKHNLGFSGLPVPMVQVGLGLIMNTDLKIRFVPETAVSAGVNKSTVKMLGFGLMHDIKQYIPGLKLAPIDLSVLVAYNSVEGNTSLIQAAGGPQPASKDGNLSYKLNSWVAQAIISKKFSVLTLYGGLGYGSVSSKVNVTGTYTIVATPSTFDIKDPVAINFNNTGMKLTMGMRLKFGPIFLNGDYTLQKYNAITVGLGVSVR